MGEVKMGEYRGYAGRMLEVNLTTNVVRERVLTPELCHDYLGGIGFNARIIYDEVPAGADPLGPDNVLVFGVGTLVGSTFPTASRTEVSGKSPLTGLFGTSNSGMFFGTRLKNAGFDALIVKGRADKPVYILIEDRQVSILEAGHPGTDLGDGFTSDYSYASFFGGGFIIFGEPDVLVTGCLYVFSRGRRATALSNIAFYGSAGHGADEAGYLFQFFQCVRFPFYL
jgi:hypothetical protein